MTDSDAVDKAQALRNQAQKLLGQAEVLELEAGIETTQVPIIDEIIDHAIKYLNVQPAEWYIPDWDKEVIALVFFNGQIKSGQMDRIRKSNNNITLNWDCSSCYMWVDTKNIIRPIYRNSHCNEPINSRWKLERTVEVHLYFIIKEVGLPKKWTKDIKPVGIYATVHRRTR